MIGAGLSLAHSSKAQALLHSNTEKDPTYSKNEIGFEIGGNSLIYSAYYQRALYRKDNMQFNIRVGGAFVPGSNDDNIYSTSHSYNVVAYVLPNFLFFNKRHAWEVGVGVSMFANFQKDTYSYYNNPYKEVDVDNSQLYFITPQVGYRLYFKNSKFYFRAAVSTFILAGYHDSDGPGDVEPKFLPWGAVGFGFSFGKK